MLPYGYEESTVILKTGENGRWKENLCWMIQKSSVDSQDDLEEGDAVIDEADVAVFVLVGLRGKPPHKLLAG